MKFFNTAGPVNRPDHYKLDPLERWDMHEILSLIQQEKYFILHAPRQTGKTSSLLALMEYLNAEGRYVCIYANIEAAQVARHDVDAGIGTVIGELSRRVSNCIRALPPDTLAPGIADGDALAAQVLEAMHTYKAEDALNAALSILCQGLRKPLVLLIDEIDALVGDTLVSVLRQIRGGYDKRPLDAPSTVVLCGVRDIRDYRIHRSNADIITGGSAFNIKPKSLRLGNFSREEIERLYHQHTEETGQIFEPSCFDLAWVYTEGQPWLVNALAYELTYEMKENRNPSVTITAAMIVEAKERLILARATPLDQLADKLSEPRVQRVILPIISGEAGQAQEDDKDYCIDLGLVKRTAQGVEIANQIYREVIPRELTKEHQDNFMAQFQPDWVRPDGGLDTDRLFTLFQDFWRENAGIWASHIQGYQEAAPQLVTQAFLQRVANGKGSIIREYALHRKRMDLMLIWKYSPGDARLPQKIVIEIKAIRSKDNFKSLKSEALRQTADYARICGADEAHLMLFDRDGRQSWRETPYRDQAEQDGVAIRIWGM